MKKMLSIIIGIVLTIALFIAVDKMGPDVNEINKQSYEKAYEQVVKERGLIDFELNPGYIVDGIVKTYVIVVDEEVVGNIQVYAE